MQEFHIDLDALKTSLNGHSVFSPSGSPMWMTCAGSLIANLLTPDSAGEDAAYGTVGHAVGEEWLKTGNKPIYRLGEVVDVVEGDEVYRITIDHSMLDYVEHYVLWCQPLPGKHYVEQRVTFSHLTPLDDQGGTADHVACTWQHMCITDLKLGIGDKIYAKDNSQAMLYALGFFYEWDWFYDFQTFNIRIAQPRIGNFDEWQCTREELLAFAELVKVKSHEAWVPGAPRTPSPKACRWCRVAPTCTARLMQLMALARGDLSYVRRQITDEEMQVLKDNMARGDFALDLVDPRTLTTEQLSALYPFIDTAKTWWEKLNGEIYRRAMAGQTIDSVKLVQGRGGRRKWKNTKVVTRVLSSYGLSPENFSDIKSPAQVEESLRALGYARSALPKLLDGLHERDAPGLRLVPAHDKGEEKSPNGIYENAFDDLNETS